MMRALIVAAVLVFLGVGALLVVHGMRSDWSTDSRGALAEFEQGLEDQARFYNLEARAHFQRALTLDPGFVMARAAMLGTFDKDMQAERDEIVAALRTVDLKRLTPRERFLITNALAKIDHRDAEAKAILDEFLATHPNDPFGIATAGREAWMTQDFVEAERLFKKLLATNPNRVEAQNLLGYIAMVQGRFGESEERFRTYRFIAPDQANPHDSLGELLIVVGRYDEARSELEAALAVKPDFCASYHHLMDAALAEGDVAAMGAAAERAAGVCAEADVKRLSCRARSWLAFTDGDCQPILGDELAEVCEDDISFLRHRCDLKERLFDAARAEEEKVEAETFEGDLPKERREYLQGVALHMVGLRLVAEGQLESGSERLRRADEKFRFWGDGQGVLKLVNRLALARTLERTGEGSEAIVEQVAAVNPALAARYRSGDLAYIVAP